MQIDPEWSVREERNLTWWGHRLAQRIWAETVMIEDGDEIVRVHAETDVLRNVNTEAHAIQSLSILNRNASLSAYVWNSETKKSAFVPQPIFTLRISLGLVVFLSRCLTSGC